MTPEDVDSLLQQLAAPAPPPRQKDRFLAEAARRLALPAEAAPLPPGARFRGMMSVAAALLVAVGVIWSMFSDSWGPGAGKGRKVDSDGDPLPTGAVRRLGSARFAHPTLIRAVALSRDGKLLASASSATTASIRLWEMPGGSRLWDLPHPGNVYALDFSPDGKRLISGGRDGTIRVWDVVSGKPLHVLQGHADEVACVAFSPDGTLLASGSNDTTVRLWDAASGTQVQSLAGQKPGIRSVAFSPDGRVLAWGNGDKTIRLQDVAAKRELAAIRGLPAVIRSLAFTPDGKTLASADADGVIRAWESETQRELFSAAGHHGNIACVTFSPDGGTLASQGVDQTIRLWDARTGKARSTVSGLNRMANVYPHGKTLAFSVDGSTLIAGDGCAVRFWEVASGKELRRPVGHAAEVESIAFQPQGKLLASVGRDAAVRLWEVESGRETLKVPWPRTETYDHPRALSFSPDGKLLAIAGGVRSVAVVLEAATGQERLRLQTPPVCSSVAFSPDGRLLAGACAFQIVLWEAATGKEALRLDVREDAAMSFSPDGKILATAGDDLRLWEVATGRLVAQSGGWKDRIHGLAFSPDGRTLVGGDARCMLRFWDAATGALIRAVEEKANPIHAVSFSPDGKLLASAGSDGIVRFRDPSTGTELFRIEGHQGGVRSLAFSPDGRRVASASTDTTVLLWDLAAARRGR